MSTDQISVRHATFEDIDTIARFQQAMAWETEGKSLDGDILTRGIRSVIEDPSKGYYVVSEAHGAVVGGLLITYEWSDWRCGTFLWIQSVYVDPDWRRKGVYRTMHNHIVDQARADRDICGVRLYVERDNNAAQLTYEGLGMSKSHYDMFEIDYVL